MNKALIWTTAIRPKTLIAGVSPVLIGTCLSLQAKEITGWIFSLTLLFAIGIQIGTNLINDYYDFIKGADTAQRKGPLRVTQAKLLPPEDVRLGAWIIFAFAFVIGSILALQGGWTILFLAMISVVFGFLYTGGPYPLGYLGLGDIFVLIFFGPVATAGTYFLQTNHWSSLGFIAGLAPGMISSAILVVNNLRDEQEDRNANKKTLIVRFGRFFGQWQYTCFLFGSLLIPLMIFSFSPFVLLLLFLFPFAYYLHKKVWTFTDQKELNIVLPQTAQFLFIYTIVFCLCSMWIS